MRPFLPTSRNLLLAAAIFTASVTDAQVAAPAPWPKVQQQTKPWTRWWWMGSAVDEKNLGAQLDSIGRAGFGGVEIVPIYGAMGYEQRYIPYLTPRWMQVLDYTTQKASSLGMGVDMAVGTGWPIGGPQVTAPLAATRLVVQKYALGPGQSLAEKIVLNDPKQPALPGTSLAALVAYGDDGSIQDLTGKVDATGKLNWTPSKGKYELYAAFSGKTRQMVKRAAPGGEGYTFDHFSKEPITAYLHTFDSVFGKTSHGVRSFFNDSYEVYGADWTPGFFEEFRNRRGYDLKPFLRELTGTEKSERVARLKSDYRETMSDLMLDNFTKTFTAWAHRIGAQNTNQAHGSPGNLLDLYAAVDIPEAETFGSSYFPIPGLRRDSGDVRNVDPDPNMLKFASSAAHAMGHNLSSSETFTWLTEHFKTSWAQCKPELEQVFLSGINHVFYHGTTYYPADAPWPGWLFYASVNFVPSNSLWPHLNGLNNYITRCQSVLQAGEPDNEVMIYWPVYDSWNRPTGMDMPLKVHDIDEWLHPTAFYKDLVQLQQKGYSLDFVSDRMIESSRVNGGTIRVTAKGAAHKVLLVPECRLMPVNTLQQIVRLARNGATVVMQQLPKDVPGLGNLDRQRARFNLVLDSLKFTATGTEGVQELKLDSGRILLAADVAAALQHAGIRGEGLTATGLKFIRRAVPNGKFYYLVNHTAKAVDEVLPLQTLASSALILDPQSGAYGSAPVTRSGNTSGIRVQLQPGEALIVKTGTEKTAAPAWAYVQPAGEPVALKGDWKLRFTGGGPVLPKEATLKQLQYWTKLEDTAAAAFSGTAEYSTSFTLPAKNAADYELALGKVAESARVWINGKEVGLLWSIPFTARVGKYLQPGKNSIRIEVANLMANRIRDMDRKGIPWRRYHEINFVNINYKPFDASVWPVQPSGLEGPVTLRPLKVVR
ncbi:glycosyl hydrolase [Paraflavisolibacter sp. H34]|uniref:glycosyl hydrolase n=1 Tax=Huijunlia imazamoxiresistens TaxID=3127457 RepID=UPI0030176F24